MPWMMTLRVAPGQIINLCTLNKSHLLPVPSCLFSWTCPLLHSPYNSNWRLLKEHKRSRESTVGRSSGSAINHMSQTHHKFLLLPPQYWEFPLSSAAIRARRTVHMAMQASPLDQRDHQMCFAGCWSGVSEKSNAAPEQSPTSSVQLHCRHN